MIKTNIKEIVPQWTNPFGTKIRKGCMSCIFAETATAEGKKRCIHPIGQMESEGKTLRPTHICEMWAPKRIYQLIGGPTTASGTSFTQGKVKSAEYIDFLVKNSAMLEDFDVDAKRQIFKYNYPSRHVYANGTD